MVPGAVRQPPEAEALGVGTVMGVGSLTDAVAAMAQATSAAPKRPDAADDCRGGAEGPSPWRQEMG